MPVDVLTQQQDNVFFISQKERTWTRSWPEQASSKESSPLRLRRWSKSFSRLYIIVSGKVKLGRRSPDGRENLLTIMGPSDMFGELSIFDPGPRTSTATTVTEVRAVSMDREALKAWIDQRPEIAEQLLRVLARRLRRTNKLRHQRKESRHQKRRRRQNQKLPLTAPSGYQTICSVMCRNLLRE